MRIQSTKDYRKFKKSHLNRKIENGNLQKIKLSIERNNLLKYRPIIINKDFEVIDGQHRLEAAQQLGVEIYYQINDEGKDEDIILLNANQRPWKVEDFLNYYVEKGYPEYIKLNNFIKRTGLKFPVAFQLVGTSSGRSHGEFKLGKFKYNLSKEDEDLKLDKVNRVRDLLKQKYMGDKTFIDSSTFSRALCGFLCFKEDQLDFESFMRKLEINLQMIKKCSRAYDYFHILLNIYNWKNRNPL